MQQVNYLKEIHIHILDYSSIHRALATNCFGNQIKTRFVLPLPSPGDSGVVSIAVDLGFKS